MKTFQPKPLKPRGNTGLKTPNPEGFWITPKTLQDRLVRVPCSRGVPPCCKISLAGPYPLRSLRNLSYCSYDQSLKEGVFSSSRLCLFLKKKDTKELQPLDFVFRLSKWQKSNQRQKLNNLDTEFFVLRPKFLDFFQHG